MVREMRSFIGESFAVIVSGPLRRAAVGRCRNTCPHRRRTGSAIHSRPARRLRRYSHRSEEHTSELQSLMRISYAVFCLKKKNCQPNLTAEHVTAHLTTTTTNKKH